MTPPKSNLQRIAQDNPRVAGFFVLLVGTCFLYFSIIEPIIHALPHGLVSISGKGGIGGAIFTTLGLTLMVFGTPWLRYMQSLGTRLSAPVLIAVGGFLAAYIVAIELLKSYLRSKGYVV